MPLISYNPEKLTHPNASDSKVAPFMAGDLSFPVPGAQVIPKEIWDKTLKSEEFGDRIQAYIDRGVFAVLENDENPTLSGKTPVKAVALVKDTFDPELLKAWQEDESRPSVVKAIAEQIVVLTPPPPKKGES